MKIPLSRLFEPDKVVASLQKAKVENMESFIQALSDLYDKSVLAFRNNLSLSDNIDCIVKDLELRHNETLTISNPDRIKTIKHITCTRSFSFAHPVTALAWQYNSQGSLDIRAQFLGTPEGAVRVTLVLYF